MAMSAETKAEILRAYNAGSSQAQILRALGGRHSRSAIAGLILRAREKGLITRAAEDDTPPAAPVVPLPRPAPPPAPAVARPAAAERPADVISVTEIATLQVTLDAATWAWLRGLAGDAALRGDRRGPAELAASMLAEIMRDDLLAEAA